MALVPPATAARSRTSTDAPAAAASTAAHPPAMPKPTTTTSTCASPVMCLRLVVGLLRASLYRTHVWYSRHRSAPAPAHRPAGRYRAPAHRSRRRGGAAVRLRESQHPRCGAPRGRGTGDRVHLLRVQGSPADRDLLAPAERVAGRRGQ